MFWFYAGSIMVASIYGVEALAGDGPESRRALRVAGGTILGALLVSVLLH